MSSTTLRGPKFSNSHQTYIAEAKGFLEYTKNLPSVSKIVLGPVKNARATPGIVKINMQPTSISCVIKSSNAVQIFYVKGPDLNTIHKELTNRFY